MQISFTISPLAPHETGIWVEIVPKCCITSSSRLEASAYTGRTEGAPSIGESGTEPRAQGPLLLFLACKSPIQEL
jgi:hypothetical protein